MSTYFL